MSDDEQVEWVAMLGRTREDRINALCDLLRHASVDDMCREDRAICRRQLHRLQYEVSGWRKVN